MASNTAQLDSSASPHLVVQVAVPVPQQRGEVLVYDYLAGPATTAPVGSIVQITWLAPGVGADTSCGRDRYTGQ